jgi:hypothetical protein
MIPLVAVVLLAGCASVGGLLNPARHLLDQSYAAIEQREFEAAYDRLAEIRTRYAHSAESREAFPIAASIFRQSYFLYRYQEPASRWVGPERRFMLEWFASFFPADEFPQAEAEALFVGMHYGYFRDFLKFAAGRPELASWSVSAEKDNGIVESIAARPRPPSDGPESVAERE